MPKDLAFAASPPSIRVRLNLPAARRRVCPFPAALLHHRADLSTRNGRDLRIARPRITSTSAPNVYKIEFLVLNPQ